MTYTSIKPRQKRYKCKACDSDFTKWTNMSWLHWCSDSCRIEYQKTRLAKAIRPRSVKRSKQETEYRRIRVKFLEDHPKCAVYPELDSTEIHHMKGRIGKLLTDTRFFLAVSRQGHERIEMNPEWAIENGYSLLRTN